LPAHDNFWRHLPEEISKENPKAVSQYVVEQFGQAEGFVFYCKSMYPLSKRAQGRPTEFADAKIHVYECSQKLRRSKPSQLPYGKTRNREGRIPLLPCTGTISAIFPSPERTVDFDIAVDSQHHLHQGRDYFGVPLKVREWIRDNSRNTPQATREELIRAIKKGEIPGVTDTYLSAIRTRIRQGYDPNVTDWVLHVKYDVYHIPLAGMGIATNSWKFGLRYWMLRLLIQIFGMYDIYQGFSEGAVIDEVQPILGFLEKGVESGVESDYPARSAVALLIVAVTGKRLRDQWIYGKYEHCIAANDKVAR